MPSGVYDRPGYEKLKKHEVASIKRAYHDLINDLAARHHVTWQTIDNIIKEKTWRQIKWRKRS